MQAAAGYNLSPTFELLLVGLLIALVPLGWLAWRLRGATPARRQHALVLLTVFLTFDLVLFGAFTRLTDSGLGCPDWPGCYGNASPIGARPDIAAAQAAQPSGPVTHHKAWIEMVHRYLATGVGALITALVLLALWQRRRFQQRLRRSQSIAAEPGQPPPGLAWPVATLIWVCLQGAFGALTVTMKLFPAIVTLHLLGGLVLLGLLAVQATRADLTWRNEAPLGLRAGLRAMLWSALALVVLQVALGGWVSTNYAVLACSGFPKCQGAWWPPADFGQGFTLWRPLGLMPDGSAIHFAALTAIHLAHRWMALPVLLLLGVAAWRLRRVAWLRRQAGWLAALAFWQLASGLANVLLGWPLAAAVAHTGGAAALVAVLCWTLAATRGGVRQHRGSSARAGVAATALLRPDAGAHP